MLLSFRSIPSCGTFALVALLVPFVHVPAVGQTTYTWSTTTTSNAWLNSANWTGGAANKFPGVDNNTSSTADGSSTDIAVISTVAFSATSIGVNMGTSTNSGNGNNAGGNGLLSLGAINFISTTKSLTIGKSDSTLAVSNLRLNGGTIDPGSGSTGNVLISISTGATQNLTIANVAGGSGLMNLQIATVDSSGVFHVIAGRTLTVSSSVTQLNQGTGFQLQGTGTMVLSGVNTYTGTAIVAGGTLSFSQSASIGGLDRRNVLVQSGGTVIAGYGLNAAFLSRVDTASTGTVALTADSSANIDLSAFSGLRLGAAGLVTYSGTITPNGTTYRLGGGGGTLTFASDITSGALSVSGASTGSVILTGANTFTGGATIHSGVLEVGKGGAAGSIAGNVANNGSLIFNRDSTTDVTYSGVISGSGSVTKKGSGNLTFTNASTYLGTTDLMTGTLKLDFNTNAIMSNMLSDSSVLTLNGGTLSILGVDGADSSQTFASTTVFNGASKLQATVGSGAGSAVTLNLGAITRTGSGTVDLTTSAGFTVNANVTPVNDIIGSYLTVNGADWATVSSGAIVAYTGYTNISSGTLADNSTANVSISTGTVSLTGSATTNINSLKLSTNFANNGTTGPAGSILRIGSGGILVPTGTVNFGFSTGAKLTAGTSDDSAAELVTHVADGATLNIAGVINNGTGAVSLVKSGNGTLNITAGSTMTGTITVNEGILNGTASTLNAGGGAIILRGGTAQLTGVFTRALTIDRDSTFLYSPGVTNGAATRFNSVISGTGNLLLYTNSTAAGAIFQFGPTGSTASTYSGTITLSAGKIQIGSSTPTSLNNAEISLGASAFIELNANSWSIDRLSGTGTVQSTNSSYTLTVGANNGSSTFDGVLRTVTGNLLLAKTGTGTLALTGSNTHTGATIVSGGVLLLANTNALSPNSTITVSVGGTLATGYTLDQTTLNRLITTSASAGTIALATDSANDLSLASITSNTLSLGAVGSATYTGTLTPVSTVYRLGGGGGTLTFDSVMVDSGTRTLTVNGSGSGGTVILTKDSTFTGATTIATGTLQLGNGGTEGIVAGNIVNNGTLIFNRSDASLDFDKVISSTGVVQFVGSGRINLTAANTYTGGTLISNGTLGLGVSNALPAAGEVVLKGGNLLTTVGTTNTASYLRVSAASSITLDNTASTSNSLTFNGLDPSSTGALSILQWAGSPDSEGTIGRLYFTNVGATVTDANQTYSTFLSTVNFVAVSGANGATFLSTSTVGMFELVPTAAVPEPSHLLLLGTAAVGFFGVIRRRRPEAIDSPVI